MISDLAGLNHHLAEWEADEQLRAIF